MTAPVCWTFVTGGCRYWHIDFKHPPHNSDEWIEYIYPDGVVHRDGELWWRWYNSATDTVKYAQLTKG